MNLIIPALGLALAASGSTVGVGIWVGGIDNEVAGFKQYQGRTYQYRRDTQQKQDTRYQEMQRRLKQLEEQRKDDAHKGQIERLKLKNGIDAILKELRKKQ